MNSLRVRIALVTLISIVVVVALATATTFFVIRDLDKDALPSRVVERVMSIATLLQAAEQDTKPRLDPLPSRGTELVGLSSVLRARLRELSPAFDAVVTRSATADTTIASIRVGSGWLSVPIADPGPPPGAWLALAGWMSLIVVGAGGIALLISYGTTRQLAMLERICLTFGTGGPMPRLPESGPAELKATARVINTMTAKLKSAVESRMRLVAAAGHDLRTPMTRMRLRAEFLDEDERSSWLADLDEMDRIADSAIRLVREETTGATSEIIRLDLLLAEVCSELSGINLPVSLGSVEPVSISASNLAVRRALRNLITNAATHGTTATVALEVSGKVARLCIDDLGPGIPEHLMPRVFEPFFRVDPARRQAIPGSGLGLAIAKEILERHGAKLMLKNRSPTGLRQEIRFVDIQGAA